MQYRASLQVSGVLDMETSSAASEEIARRIRSARARAGLTRKQLAAASSASERYLAKLEAGTGNPSVEMLVAISGALNIAMADLLPMGGERDEPLSQAAAMLRRLAPGRLHEALSVLHQISAISGEKAHRIGLIGLRGAGKTSLGAALAERLCVPFIEISKEVERRYGGSIAVLLEINGPSALRRYEAEVLEQVVAENEAAVITAPGAIVSEAALYDRLLQSHWTVWLEATPEDHMQRVVAQGDLRPMTGNRTAMADLRSILAAREAEYVRADARLNTSAQGFTATLNALERLVNRMI
jgi:XRE family transcriptional regulator, aerobic/anaerobic benzoate catabolism transcriptional regulator